MRIALEQNTFGVDHVTLPVYKDQHDWGVVPSMYNPDSWNWLITCDASLEAAGTQTLKRVMIGNSWDENQWTEVDNYTDARGYNYIILKQKGTEQCQVMRNFVSFT